MHPACRCDPEVENATWARRPSYRSGFNSISEKLWGIGASDHGRCGLNAETFDATEDRRHDPRPQPSRAPNRRQQLAGKVGLLDAGLETCSNWRSLFVERLGPGQDHDGQPIRKVIGQLYARRAFEIPKGQIE